jgi:hypothetical protein
LTACVIYDAHIEPAFTMNSMTRIFYVLIPALLLIRLGLRLAEPRLLGRTPAV